MKKLLMLICLIAISCEKVELLPTTSLDINQKIKSYKGNKVVLLNVWSLWCVPCVDEFPMIVALGQEIEFRGKNDERFRLNRLAKRPCKGQQNREPKPARKTAG